MHSMMSPILSDYNRINSVWYHILIICLALGQILVASNIFVTPFGAPSFLPENKSPKADCCNWFYIWLCNKVYNVKAYPWWNGERFLLFMIMGQMSRMSILTHYYYYYYYLMMMMMGHSWNKEQYCIKAPARLMGKTTTYNNAFCLYWT